MQRVAFVVILAVAAAARLWYLGAGVPHAVGIDEPQVIGRAITILRTGDWNTHIFDYPTLVIYLHAAVAIVRFLLGAVQGEWSSLDTFSVGAIFSTGRLVAALIGVATVWLTYRLAREITGRGVALLAAAQLAVLPMHVRESHFILTDVPATALSTLAVWLAVRAGRRRELRAYAWAGAACGLAAAAKYTGGVALAAPVTAWIVHELRDDRRLLKLGALAGAAAAAFLAGAPFTVLDMPAFLDGFAAQFSRFAARASLGDPSWLLYVKHLSPPWARFAVPLALAGMAVLLLRRETRQPAAPAVVFGLAYFYVLASHSHVFGRYALPLLPLMCLFWSAAALALIDFVSKRRRIAHPLVRPLLVAAALVLLVWRPASEVVRWLDQFKEADTRTIAAQWLKTGAPNGARVAVENSGPTYLDAAGFRVVPTELLVGRPVDWYRSRADYLVISATDLSGYGDLLAAGPTVFQISPTAQRWGPPIVIVQLAGALPK
jgi:4-amino-4-deoxy-L-arabinose transferase-like glycosyltransferase